MNIYQKLIEVRKTVPYLQKSADGPQFKYVSSSQVLANVKAKMDELGLLLIPSVTGHRVTGDTIEYTDRDGRPKHTTTYLTELDINMTWINAEKPDETIVSPWYGQGVDIAGEKGVGKALTYAEKYFMLKFFNIPTDKDDPDSFQQRIEGEPEPEHKPAPKSAPSISKKSTSEIITEVQVKELEKLAKELKGHERQSYWDFLKGLEKDGLITSQYPLNKEKKVQWTSKDYEEIKNRLEMPF